METLSSFEWALAVYVASTIHEDASRCAELERRLVNLGAPAQLLENIRRGAIGWSVSDDEYTEAIAGYAAKFTRTPGRVDARDVQRLQAAGLTPVAIRQLNNAVAFVGHVARAADTR